MKVSKRDIKFVLTEYEGCSSLDVEAKTTVEVHIGENDTIRADSMANAIKAVDKYINNQVGRK